MADGISTHLIYTAGLTHAVSYLVNGLRLPAESGAERFPDRHPDAEERI